MMYWFCIVGPVDESLLKDGADFPMRRAVEYQLMLMGIPVPEHLYSGWGVTDADKERMLTALNSGVVNDHTG